MEGSTSTDVKRESDGNPPIEASSTGNATILIATIIAAVIPASFYIAYINHYGTNFLYYDDWGLVPIVNAALHGQLTISILWVQHNENRMLVPNMIFTLFGTIGKLNTKSIMYFSAGLFTVSYALLLLTFRSYANRWLGPLFTLIVGCVWFSTADTDNSLWAFQMAWYLILLCFMVMLYVLSRQRMTLVSVTIGGVVATMASFSSLQGLLLWPIGLLVIVWRSEQRRSMVTLGGIWALASMIVAGVYFHGFNFQSGATGGGSVGFAVRHPFEMLTYFVAAVGNVIPSTSSASLHTHEALGSVLCVAALVVVVQCLGERSSPARGSIPLPATLILYGILFDLSIAFGRLSFGVAQALAPRYTMANILLLIGIALHVIHRADAKVRPVHSSRARRNPIALVVLSLMMGLLIVQVAWGVRFGIVNGSVVEQSRVAGARTVTNLDRMSTAESEQYVSEFAYPNLKALDPLLTLAERDHLNVFVPSVREKYRKLGPPKGTPPP